MLSPLRTPIGTAAFAIAGAAITKRLLRQATAIDLNHKVVLITGASTGLGLQLARECAARGAKLVICARTEERLRQAEQDLTDRGAEVLAVVADVSKKDDVAALVQAAHIRFGGVDVLICNAGVIQVGQFESMRAEQFESAMNGMFFGTLYPIQELLPSLANRPGGRIAIVSSIGGKVSVPHMLPYDAAKFALAALGEGLRTELGQNGIPVTTIYPGLIRNGSYLNAEFAGHNDGQEASYRLFSVLSSLPLLTADGEKAAQVYVNAIRRGDAEAIYPPHYNLLSRFHGIAPVLTTEVFGFACGLMPKTGQVQGVARGSDVEDRMEQGSTWRTLTALGRNATEQFQLWRNTHSLHQDT